MKKKAAAILSLAVLIPALLFVAGIIAQFILNTTRRGTDLHSRPECISG